MPWLQAPIGWRLRNLSERDHCLMVLLLHVTLTLCSGLFAGECHLLSLPCILPALACANLSLLLPYADILGNPNSQIQDGMIGIDDQFECEMGHWLP